MRHKYEIYIRQPGQQEKVQVLLLDGERVMRVGLVERERERERESSPSSKKQGPRHKNSNRVWVPSRLARALRIPPEWKSVLPLDCSVFLVRHCPFRCRGPPLQCNKRSWKSKKKTAAKSVPRQKPAPVKEHQSNQTSIYLLDTHVHLR